MSDRWQYLLVLAACLAITAPLEIFGPGVYRQPRRLIRAVLLPALIFLIWDEVAVAGHVWTYDPAYITGLVVPFQVPIEEVLFFIVIPLCALLTYNAVSTVLDWAKRR
jgi:lycopene cyclase domain-containing protein